MKVGDRVQLHPATDAWMRGDRYGLITQVEYPLVTEEGELAPMYRVKLDKSRSQIWYHPKNIEVIP